MRGSREKVETPSGHCPVLDQRLTEPVSPDFAINTRAEGRRSVDLHCEQLLTKVSMV